jgi:hypothetical protein
VEASYAWVSSPSLEVEEELVAFPCAYHVKEVEKEVDSRLDPGQLQKSCCALLLQLVNAIVRTGASEDRWMVAPNCD